MPRHIARITAVAATALLATAAVAPAGPAHAVTAAQAATAPASRTAETPEGLADVLFVGNNWEGTIDVLSGSGDLRKVGRLNAIPDKQQRMLEIALNPVRWPIFLYIRNTAGEGHDQFVDDTYSTPDGSAVIVSRPSFADVVSISTATNAINWRFPMIGFRADHMALSPDGTRVAVSDSSANLVHVLDIATGQEVGRFSTGDRPHENVFSPDGRYIWNMAIGNVENSFDDPASQRSDVLKGKRLITVVDAQSFAPVKVIDMRDRLDAAGMTTLSDAVRPIAFTPGFDKAYFQVSFYNGFLEYDLGTDRITRHLTLPESDTISPNPATWVNDSRHHGIAMRPDGTQLCVAGTMDDYATVVDRVTFAHGPLVPMNKPYWATVSADGTQCVVSESGSDAVSAIDFATGTKTVTVPVGDHPQRVRQGVVPTGWAGPKA